MNTNKVVTAEEAVSIIKDGDTVFTCGIETLMLPDKILEALEKRFLETGHPNNLIERHHTVVGMQDGTGLERFAHEGMVKKAIGSGFSVLKTSKYTQMLNENKIEAYLMPMGTVYEMLHRTGAGDPFTIVQTGIGTFVDPDVEGGRMNAVSKDTLCKHIDIDGEDFLCYKNPKIDVTIIRGTTADTFGNLTVEHEPINAGIMSAAMAAKASGGKVIVQAERLAAHKSLRARDVVVPGIMVDYVVICPDQAPSGGVVSNPGLTGEIKIPTSSYKKFPLDAKKAIARRATMELTDEDVVVNLGVGIPAHVPLVQIENTGDLQSVFFPEHGAIGGVPAERAIFGVNYNPEAVIDSSFVFPFFRGGGLDMTCLGCAEFDQYGNVNVSKFNGIVPGCGGFIDITHTTKKIVFCGTFSAVGSEIEIKDGELHIIKEGQKIKIVENVEQITLNGRKALEKGQQVIYITERAVFKNTPDGIELIEVAPGVDVEKDVISKIPFKVICKDVKLMPKEVFID